MKNNLVSGAMNLIGRVLAIFFLFASASYPGFAFSTDQESPNLVQVRGKPKDLQFLTGYDFTAYIRSVEEKYGKDRSGFVGELQSKRFTCNFSPSQVYFECVRFGCKRDFPFSKYLMQWSVSSHPLKPETYIANTISYQFAMGCYRPADIIKEQEKFVLRRNQSEQ